VASVHLRLAYKAMLVALLPYATLFGQSVAPVVRPPASHVHGIVRSTSDDSPLPSTKVVFKGEKFSTTLYTDGAGAYQAALPVGTYTMTVEPSDYRFPVYQRPLFRVGPSMNITIDVSIPSEVMIGCDIGVRLGQTEPDPDDYVNSCGGSVSFPVPSQEGTPLEVLIRFGGRELSERGYVYTAEWNSSPTHIGTQVFVAYNLFTLLADRVAYDARTGIVEANGHVTAEGADGKKRRADSMTFKIENGQTSPLP